MEREQKTQGMMRFSSVFSNNGFLGIPLAMAVFGAGSMALMVVIILNIVTNVLMYTLGRSFSLSVIKDGIKSKHNKFTVKYNQWSLLKW